MSVNDNIQGPSLATAISPSLLPSPKLHQFKYRDDPIEWGRRLDDAQTGLISNNGYVFEVKIRSRMYALKIFKFFNPDSTEYYWRPLLGYSVPLKEIIEYTDPFCAECRAYGRIQEASEISGFHDQLAVKCHGYLYLGDKEKNKLEYMGLDLGTAVLDDQLRQALDGGGRVRAIVKDLAPARTPITSSNVQAARHELMKLHELKIYVRDIGVGKFCDGKLVSLSNSWTEPHTILDALGADEAEEESAADLVMFHEMIEESSGHHPSLAGDEDVDMADETDSSALSDDENMDVDEDEDDN